MRTIQMPGEAKAAQQEVLRRIRQDGGDDRRAHIRVLVLWDEGRWAPACGRIDVARAEDEPVTSARPVAGARVLSETVRIQDLAARLTAAFAGEPLLVEGKRIAGHGLDGGWNGARHTDDWGDYGAPWPLAEYSPIKSIARPSSVNDVFEATGKVTALNGITDCLRLALGYPNVRDSRDTRACRINLYVWDYRGAFLPRRTKGALLFLVRPPNDPYLTLAVAIRDDSGTSRSVHPEPSEVVIPLKGVLRDLNMTLRSGDDVVCERQWDEATERFKLHHDGVYGPPPVAPELDPIHAGSTVAEVALPFMKDHELARLVARDLSELDSAVRGGSMKSALILAGSILEAVLLDVLGRNELYVRKRLGKKWPDGASTRELIEAAGSTEVPLADGRLRFLLPVLTAKKGAVLIDHRNLIHPRAEVRGATPIDAHSVRTIQGVLGDVLRDLHEAHRDGVLDAYGRASMP